VRVRYKGLRPFRLHVKDKTYILNEGDVVEVDPWKIRSKRLISLFDILVDDEEALTEREKKLLKIVKLKKGR